jgi:hypothetical protein
MTVRTLPLIGLMLLVAVSSARAQSLAANSTNSESEEDRLAREVDDPTAILTQLKLGSVHPTEFPDDRADQHGPGATSYTG